MTLARNRHRLPLSRCTLPLSTRRTHMPTPPHNTIADALPPLSSPNQTTSPPLCNQLLIHALQAYQRFISPYKGYCCAHHQLHEQGSCSHFGIECLTHEPLQKAFRHILQRSRECRSAGNTLRGRSRRSKRSGHACNIFFLFCDG